MLWEKQKVVDHNHPAWGDSHLNVNLKSYLCRSLPALRETGAQSLGRNLTFYFMQVRGEKRNSPMTTTTQGFSAFSSLSTVQMHNP